MLLTLCLVLSLLPTVTLAAKNGSDGKASASVTQSQVSSAIEAAQEAAQSNGGAPRVKTTYF